MYQSPAFVGANAQMQDDGASMQKEPAVIAVGVGRSSSSVFIEFDLFVHDIVKTPLPNESRNGFSRDCQRDTHTYRPCATCRRTPEKWIRVSQMAHTQ